jgi:sigma-E factor negative regulatory protein RseA
MNPELKQQLSELMDGELSRDQTRFLIKRLSSDAELGDCWQRWQLVSTCVRGNAVVAMRPDFVARVSVALQSESSPRVVVSGVALKWVGGFAVAASVALAAIVAVRPVPAPNAGTVADTSATAAPIMAAAEVAPSPYREQDLRPPLRDAQTVASADAAPLAASVRIDPRIERYLVRHNEALGTQGYGFVPYVTLVTPLREVPQPMPETAR